jgi:serine/threonine-protein kinase
MTGASPQNAPSAEAPLIVDRYAIYDAIASGGMATVHLGRLIGTAGFLRTVAIKRLHAQFANDPEFTSMFLDEARLASRIQHPNVVSTLDVVMKDHELLLVMEYVRGESLSRLVRRARDAGGRLPPRVVVAIVAGALQGLHAAHEASDEKGQPLGLVHRDMTPQNILVGTDGVARVLDFGVAKAAGRVHTTRDGDIKGKVLYMSPEQLSAQPLSRTADIYAAGVVLFEALTGVRMFAGDNEGAALTRIIKNELTMPSAVAPELAPFDAIVRRASAANPADRYPTAQEMARALENVTGGVASHSEVSDWVQRLCGELLDERARIVAEIERSSTRSRPPLPFPSSGAMRADGQPTSGVSQVSQVSQLAHASQVGTVTSLTGINAVNAGLNGSSGVTAMTGVSAVMGAPQPRSRSMVAIALVVMGLLVAVSVTVSVMLLRQANQKAESAATAAPTVTATAAATSTSTSTSTSTGGEPANVSAPAVARTGEANAAPPATGSPAGSDHPASPASSASASAGGAKSGGATGTTGARRNGNVGAPTGGGRVVNCDPPYTIDKNGHQHFIPECLK